MSIHGSRQSDTRTLVDGVEIRNLANEGHSTNFVPDMGSTQEVTLDYAASSAETMTGGLLINNIPREGGNRVQGLVLRHRRQLVVSGQQLLRRSRRSAG